MLNGKQTEVVALLVVGETQAAAAQAVGVTPETVSRWKQDAEFIAALNQAQRQKWTDQRERLRSLIDQALSVYSEALTDADDMATRVRVARDVLDRLQFSEIPAPHGPVTVAEVERDRKQQAGMARMLDSLADAMAME